jgi:hypothetical protein
VFFFGSTFSDLEFIAYIGIRACENCDDDGHHGLYRAIGKASVFFIPVAKWGKSLFVICNRCKAGYKVTEGEAVRLRSGAASLPEPERCADIWNALVDEWERVRERATPRSDGKLDFDTLMKETRSRVETRFPEKEVEAVVAWSFIVTQLQHYGVLEEARPRIDWPTILWP